MKKNYLAPDFQTYSVELEENFLESNLDLKTDNQSGFYWDD